MGISILISHLSRNKMYWICYLYIQAEAQRPLRMGEDGTEPEEIGFVFDFK